MSYLESLKDYYDSHTEDYKRTYTGNGRYRSNFFRARIVHALVDQISPHRILDAGCGDGQILIALLKKGHRAVGFDNSKRMIVEAEKNLLGAGFPQNKVMGGDIYNIPRPDGCVDLVLCLGVMSNLPNHTRIFSEFKRVLTPAGRIIISLDNDLFSLFSMNRQTVELYRDLFSGNVPSDVAQDTLEDITESLSRLWGGKIPPVMADSEIDKSGITIPSYNALSVGEILPTHGFKVEEIRFYHYHPIPPPFEVRYPDLFREAEKLETVGKNWRGGILCNAMVIQAQREEQ